MKNESRTKIRYRVIFVLPGEEYVVNRDFELLSDAVLCANSDTMQRPYKVIREELTITTEVVTQVGAVS